MAEGGSDSVIAGGHEFVFDFNCTICIRDKETYTEASHFCPNCNQYYCKKCFFNFGCDHGILGRAEVGKWGKPSQRIHFDECPDHKTNTLQLYCKRDDVVCCAICGQTDHKNCGQLKYIPLIASGKKNKEYLKRLQTDLQQLQITNDQLLKDWTTKLADLQENHRQLTADIKQLKASYIAELDKLEQESLNDVNKFKAEFENKFKFELKKINDIKSQLFDLQSKLKKHNIDDSLMFARIKQGTELIKKCRKALSEVTCSKVQRRAQFEADERLEECMHGLQRLGTLTTDTSLDSGNVVGHRQGQGHGLGPSSIQTNRPYIVKQRTSVNVKVKGDKSTCSIRGMCQLPDGSILLADCDNEKLKRLDGSDRVIGSCPLSNSPYGVCNTELGEVAVALWYSKTIQFVSVGDTMTTTRSFSTSHYCDILAYHNKRLYVPGQGCDSTVYVYSLSGSLLHTISTDQHGTRMFSDTRDITVSPVTGRIYVADYNKGLVALDLEGNLLNTYKPPGLEKGASSVCVDGVGNVFVQEYNSCSVVQVGRDGASTVATIVARSDNKDNGYRLCFDNVGTRLLVSCFDNVGTRLLVSSATLASDTVTVLHLKH